MKQRSASRRQVRLYRWRKQSSQHGNFGDEITIPILERLFGIEAVPVEMERAELIAAGSILDGYWNRQNRKLRRGKTMRGASAFRRITHWLTRSSDLHVWGSGFIQEDSEMLWPQPMHVHAVRGELTAGRLGTEVTCRGDPGLLASLLLDAQPEKATEVAVVPSHVDTQWLSSTLLPSFRRHWQLIDPEQPVLDVVKQIASAELVIASSLHGLIVADAFGIPCLWARSHRPLAYNSHYKFYDYASSRGCPFGEPVEYEQIIALNVDALARMGTTVARSVSDWQQTLIKAFPF